MHKSLFITIILSLISTTAFAQTVENTEASPFENDPFFSMPVSKWLNNSSAEGDTISYKKYGRDRRPFVRLNSNGLDYEGIINAGPYNAGPLYSVYPNLPMIHYNQVNALFLGFKKERMQWYHDESLMGIPHVQFHGLIGYSTGQREWQYSLGLEKLLGRDNHFIIGGGYHNATSTNDEWRVGLHETTLTAFTVGYDYLDYYKQKGWGIYFLARTERYFQGGIAFNDDQFSSLNQETSWALFGSHGNFRQNPPIELQNGLAVDTVDIASLTLSGSFNPKRLPLNRDFAFSLTGIAEFADPGIGTSSYSYSKYTAELASYFNFEPGGVLKYRLRMSGITGEAPRFKQLYLGGVGTLRALPFKSLGAGNRMILSNVELQFGSPVYSSNGWINFEDFYLSLFLDSGWVDEVRPGNPLLAGFGNFTIAGLRHNGGMGLGSSLIRAEVAWDFDNPERAPVLWLRFNPTF